MTDIFYSASVPNLYENAMVDAGTAVLFIHGYMGDPCQFDTLARRLHEAHYKLYALRLPGHGSDAKSFLSGTRAHWLQAVLDTVEQLRPLYRTLILCGHSMGGLLAVMAASQVSVDGIIFIATPLLTRVTWCSIRMALLSITSRIDESDTYLAESKRCAGVTFKSPADGLRTLPRLFDLLYLTRSAREKLSGLSCPALIIQSKNDESVHPVSARILHKKLGGHSRILHLKSSRHFYHPPDEEAIVVSEVMQFVETIDLAASCSSPGASQPI